MSSENKLPVIWHEKSVGFIVNPKCDNFDLYGKWQPNQNSAYKKFLEWLETYGEAEVEIANNECQIQIRGTVETEPNEEIDIKVRMNTI
ncbi:MAG: hypothetical protein VSS75_007605 [Candidatus Parabeggiatoa sp.]|nr:hypothetical protein [Candidatus Parabeggiatoa sp.]